MGIGVYERVALKGWILEQTSSIFDRAPPLRGKLANLGRSFRHARDEAAFAIDDAGKPVPRDVMRTEEGQEFAASNANGQPAKGLTVLEDWDFDSGNPILRDADFCKTSDMTIEPVANARCWASIASGLRRGRGCARLGQSVHELLAIHIGDQYPGTLPCREFTACLSLERVEVVIKQRR